MVKGMIPTDLAGRNMRWPMRRLQSVLRLDTFLELSVSRLQSVSPAFATLDPKTICLFCFSESNDIQARQ